MLRFTPALIAAGFAAVALAMPANATTKTKHRIYHHRVVAAYVDPRPPLEVNRRSWLDPGTAVPQGSQERYVQANTSLNLTPDQMYTGQFGNETLPRRFEIPTGEREEPLVEFWTPAPRY
jgi:hypothetical protein